MSVRVFSLKRKSELLLLDRTLKRWGFHVFIQAAIVEEMITVNTFNEFVVCGICNRFLQQKERKKKGKFEDVEYANF